MQSESKSLKHVTAVNVSFVHKDNEGRKEVS